MGISISQQNLPTGNDEQVFNMFEVQRQEEEKRSMGENVVRPQSNYLPSIHQGKDSIDNFG